MNTIIPIITNQRLTPYRIGTSDKIQIKTQVFSDNKGSLSYLPNLPVELYLNYSGDWSLAEAGITNNQGICTLYHECTNISGIAGFLAKSIVTVHGSGYISNITKINLSN